MTSPSIIPEKRGSSKTDAAHPGNLESRARAAASECEIILDLARALNVDFQVACHFNDKLKLGLPVRRKVEGPKTEGRAVPKPAKKGAGK